jgi:hypothetical protein
MLYEKMVNMLYRRDILHVKIFLRHHYHKTFQGTEFE